MGRPMLADEFRNTNLEDLQTFLMKRANAPSVQNLKKLESKLTDKWSADNIIRPSRFNVHYETRPLNMSENSQSRWQRRFDCLKCEAKHPLYRCPLFLNLKVDDRMPLIKACNIVAPASTRRNMQVETVPIRENVN